MRAPSSRVWIGSTKLRLLAMHAFGPRRDFRRFRLRPFKAYSTTTKTRTTLRRLVRLRRTADERLHLRATKRIGGSRRLHRGLPQNHLWLRLTISSHP